MNKLLVICGPTATGKTALAAELARKFNGELISADSRQVYRGMDIGTGKDRPDVPIWMYDVAAPNQEFSVSHWVKLAKPIIADIIKRNKLPIVVGGTGLYINALINPFETIDIPPNKALRKKLQALTVAELQKMVKRSDMNDSDWQNPRRLIRKIEIAREKHIPKKQDRHYDSLVIGLRAPLPALFERIDRRVYSRITAGMKDEIGRLRNYSRDLPSMSAFGYKDMSTWKQDEHAYARRQMTWFRKQSDVHWFDITRKRFSQEIVSLVRTWYN